MTSKKLFVVSMVLLTIIVMGAVNAAEDLNNATAEIAVDSGGNDDSLVIDEVDAGGDVVELDSQSGQSDIAAGNDVKNVENSNKLGSSDADVLGVDDYDAFRVYVSPDGDDSNGGSEDDPLQTISAAVQMINEWGAYDGARIYLYDGVHSLNEQIQMQCPISFIGVEGEHPIIDLEGTGTLGYFYVQVEEINLKNIEFINMPGSWFFVSYEVSFSQLNIEDCIFNVASTDG